MPLDTTPLKQTGIQHLRGFFDAESTELMEKLGREVSEGVKSGRLARSSQLATGLDTDWFNAFFKNPALMQVVTDLIGPDVACLSWRILMKDTHFSGPIVVHQDWSYFGGDTHKLNVFIPLTRVNRGNGAIVFFEGSHQFGPIERGAIDVDSYPDLMQTCPELEIGDVLLGDFLTWHSSVPATEVAERIMVQLVFQPSSDPSSHFVVAGQLLNQRSCPDRFAPLLEPYTDLNVRVAQSYLDQGNVERAERYAKGVLASDPDSVGAAILLHDITKDRDPGAAHFYLNMARASLEKLAAQVDQRTPADAAPAPAPLLQPAAAEAKPSLLSRVLARARQSA
jgi:hypothetical protein